MFSSKNNSRKAITLTIASAMVASLLTGCSDSVAEQNSSNISNPSAKVTSSVTSKVYSESTSVEIPETAEIISTVDSENPTLDVISDTESVEILPIETTESMSDSQNTDEEIMETSEEADQIAQEREDSIPMATDEQVAQIEQDRQDRQDLADDTSAYTTDGIPLTTNGDLTEPAKPTANYKLPEGAQLEFTGDPDTAIYTELPDGCYWTPSSYYPNAFTDPAGNRWCNQQFDPISNIGMGYLTPDGSYHASQEEIDEYIRFTNEMQARHDTGPTNDGTSNMTEEEGKALAELFGF